MIGFLANTLILLGALVIVLGAVGLIRLPDVLSRANAATKAATLGVGSVLLGSALLADNGTTGVKLTLAAVLLLVTSPVAGHLIGRAAYLAGAPLWEGTVADDLAPRVGETRGGDDAGVGQPPEGDTAEVGEPPGGTAAARSRFTVGDPPVGGTATRPGGNNQRPSR